MKHFVYLTDTRVVSLVTTGKRIAARREFAASGAGAAEFERYLAGVRNAPLHLFTDFAEEDIRLDTVPHVGAGDRQAILNRKLAQMFRNTPYRHAVVQGRETEGRRDDRVIYSAITNPALLQPWLEAVDKLHVPLEGIHSVAVFSSLLLEELDLFFPHTLLVTFTPGEEMRQTYFRSGEIKFSRLTPIDLEPGQSLGAMIAEETTRTWQYLDSLRHFGTDDRLEVCILVHANDRAAIEPAMRDFAQIQYRLLDMDQVAAKLGLKPAPLDSTADEVMVHLFFLRKVPNHFASPELRRHATLRSARVVVKQLSAVLVLASIGWAGWNVSRVFSANEADNKVAQELRNLDREYDTITRSLPSFGVGGSTMRDAVSFYNGSIRGFPTLSGFVVPLSRVLAAYPEVRLEQLGWVATDDPKVTPRLTLPPQKGSLPVKAILARAPGEPASQAAEAANPPFAGGRYEVALLAATVRVPVNDYRGAMAEVERLAADIAKLDGFRADVVESPLDVSPSAQLQGRQVEGESPLMEPRFLLRIVRERRGAA